MYRAMFECWSHNNSVSRQFWLEGESRQEVLTMAFSHKVTFLVLHVSISLPLVLAGKRTSGLGLLCYSCVDVVMWLGYRFSPGEEGRSEPTQETGER